ncbi:MAG: hypothetical protein ACRD9R_17925 [Pyrinomonadaceae bacterium]
MKQNRPKKEKQLTDNSSLTLNQQNALLALEQLLNRAKSFENARLRIRTQAHIADTMWAHDEPRARRLFEEAFREADILNSAKRSNNTLMGPSPSGPLSPDGGLLKEILALASRHDISLVEKLVASSASDSPASQAATPEKQTNVTQLSEPYLQAALSVVESDPERASQLIKASLNGGINRLLPRALSTLQEKNSSLASEIFASAILVAASEATRIDENTRLLALFVFPSFGVPSTPLAPGQNPIATDQVIGQFLGFAFDTAIRWHSKVTNSGNQAAAARDIFDYDTAQSLLPYFVRDAPDKAEHFRGIVSLMSQAVPRRQTNDLIAKIAQPASFSEALKEAEAATNPMQKDLLYFRAATTAASRGEYDVALSLVEKVSVEDFRTGFDAALRLHAVNALTGKGEIDLAHRYAKGSLDVRQRAALLGRIANALIDKNDRGRALEILDEAEQLATKTDEGPAKAQAMLILTNTRIRLNPVRGFESMEATVKAFNRANSGAKEGDVRAATGPHAMFSAMMNSLLKAETPDFRRGFSELAQSDFDRALRLAQSLNDLEQNVPAQLAVCQSVLINGRGRGTRRRTPL